MISFNKNFLTFSILQKNAQFKNAVRRASYWVDYLSWFFLSSKRSSKLPKKTDKILVINHGALGDVFCSLRTVYSLAQLYSKKKFTLAVPNHYLKEIKKLETDLGFKIVSEEKISQKEFNIILLFNEPAHFKPFLPSFYVGSEYSSLTGSFKYGKNKFLNRKINPLLRHKMDQERAICKLADLPLPRRLKSPSLSISNEFKRKINRIGKYVLIHPSGRNFAEIVGQGEMPALAWSSEKFAEIADFIIEKYGLSVVLTGSKEERSIGDEIKKKAKNKASIFNLAGDSSVIDLASLVYLSELAISIDTSTVHIAELYDKPIIALFGPTFHEEVGPYGNPKNQITLSHPSLCIRDRRKGKASYFPGKGMDSISTREVKNALVKLL